MAPAGLARSRIVAGPLEVFDDTERTTGAGPGGGGGGGAAVAAVAAPGVEVEEAGLAEEGEEEAGLAGVGEVEAGVVEAAVAAVAEVVAAAVHPERRDSSCSPNR